MDSFDNNKNFSDVLVRYLNRRSGFDYKSIDTNQIPDKEKPKCDVDAVLYSENYQNLFLQLKQVRDNTHTKVEKAKGMISFTSTLSPSLHSLFKKNIKKWENKYGDDANKLILLLHLRNGYLISDDGVNLREELSGSTFKGIYIVSPEIKFVEGETNEEFVTPIKDFLF